MAHGPWTHNAIARLSLIGSCQGQSIVSVHHFEATGTVDAAFASDSDIQTWAANIASDFNTNCKTLFLGTHSNDYTLLNIQSQGLERKTYVNRVLTPTDLTPTSPVVGTLGAPADDMTTAVVLKWRTPLAGKMYRGRTYLGPFPDVQTDQGKIVTAQMPLFTNYLNVLLGRYTGIGGLFAGARMTIYSRPYNKYEYGYVKGHGADRAMFWPEDYDGNSTNITTGSVDPTLRTQRRRQLGVGS